MTDWSDKLWSETINGKISYGIIMGKGLSGKSSVAQMLGSNHGFTVLDMKAVADEVKGRLGTEEEPFEGEVPLAEVEKDIVR